ncbi:292_t:CDS:2 [Funneliformis mosseae]|uniref:292_t:CDS:1 n=1 Tax=Funneliformis mosseae TaxID=27381 RepID=A0A9N8Z0J9_FUNMO|nr:292_t:CDS:2 [Funneliformis mosseae]
MLPQKLGKIPQNIILPVIPTFISISIGAVLGINHVIKSEIIEKVEIRVDQISERLDKLQETVELIKADLKVIKGILMQKK